MRLALGAVVLAPLRGRDLTALAELLPDDLELDPSIPLDAALPRRDARALAFRESVHRAWRTWEAPSSWALPLAVRAEGELVGAQWLESVDWPGRREVDSSSWLVTGRRGRGIGTAARRCVLALAFGPLDARGAVSSAWSDNEASLRVSRALGYVPTHTTPHIHGARVGSLAHVRLERATWLASGAAGGVRLDVSDDELASFREPALPPFVDIEF